MAKKQKTETMEEQVIAKGILWEGYYYPTYTAMSNETGFTLNTCRKYVHRGITTMKERDEYRNDCRLKKIRGFEWDGVKYKNDAEAAKALKVSINTIAYRKMKGYKMQSDVSNSPHYGVKVKYKGKTYPTIGKAIVHNTKDTVSASSIRREAERV